MGEWEREAYFRSELARLCRSACIPFVALWGRDIGKRLGAHLHLGLFWPTREIPRLVGLVERVSGSSAEFVRIAYEQDTASRSVCGGWQIDVNNRNDAEASALEWAGYVAGQPCKHPAPPMLRGKAFGLSQAIGRSAQEAARAQLDERRERTALRLQNGS